jgi:RNA polymerase sigma-70 factor (sigma-E family)
MGQDADRAVAALYRLHYRFLVGLAMLLVRDIATAEGLVQDSFVAMHSAWRRLEDSDRALSYLHHAVVSRSRSVRRHRAARGEIRPGPAPGGPAGARFAATELECSTLVSVLWSLAPRQREVLVLLYYADLPETQIASVMGISKGAVKSHAVQAMSSLRAELREPGSQAPGGN